MQVERYGHKWTRKRNGYYQSTVAIDGARRWLHQYTYTREVGAITPGWHVHHRDHDKDNNAPENLECLSPGSHEAAHSEGRKVRGASPEQLTHLEAIRGKALAAKQGKYVGHRKLRTLAVRQRVCPVCEVTFTLSQKSRDDCTYCSDACRSTAQNKYTSAEWYAPRTCAQCGEQFVPGHDSVGHQLFCSESCRDKHRYANKHISRKCKQCGTVMHLSAGNASRYCDACRAAGAGTHKHECAACGRQVVSRVRDGNVYCDRRCANHARGLVGDAARHARYKQAVREGRVDPRDRVPRDI